MSTLEVISPDEQRRLVELEIEFAKIASKWIEGAAILVEIRDRRLYREKYMTFESYCLQRWQMGRQRAYELIWAKEVAENVMSTLQNTQPSNFIPLKPLEPDQQRETWDKAVETAPNGKITGKHVRKTRDDMIPQKESIQGNGVLEEIGWLVTHDEHQLAMRALDPESRYWKHCATEFFTSLRNRKVIN